MTGINPAVASTADPNCWREIPNKMAIHKKKAEKTYPIAMPIKLDYGMGINPTTNGVKFWRFTAMMGRIAAVISNAAATNCPKIGKDSI